MANERIPCPSGAHENGGGTGGLRHPANVQGPSGTGEVGGFSGDERIAIRAAEAAATPPCVKQIHWDAVHGKRVEIQREHAFVNSWTGRTKMCIHCYLLVRTPEAAQV